MIRTPVLYEIECIEPTKLPSLSFSRNTTRSTPKNPMYGSRSRTSPSFCTRSSISSPGRLVWGIMYPRSEHLYPGSDLRMTSALVRKVALAKSCSMKQPRLTVLKSSSGKASTIPPDSKTHIIIHSFGRGSSLRNCHSNYRFQIPPLDIRF